MYVSTGKEFKDTGDENSGIYHQRGQVQMR